jgi:hypothetical protein
LAIDTIEHPNTSISELWQKYLERPFDNHDPLHVVKPQSFHPFTPAISSLAYLVTSHETTRTTSTESSYDNIDFNLEHGTASIGASGDQDSAIPSMAERDIQHTTGIVQESNPRKRKASNTENSWNRSKFQQHRISRCEGAILQVESYIQMEKEKCERLCIPYNEQNYLPPNMAQWISTLKKENERAAVSIITTTIGSSESIALLQDIVAGARAGTQKYPVENLTIANRVRQIQQLGDRIAYIEFLRRCHIWKLYKDISENIRTPKFAFHITTPASVMAPKGRRPGNPKILEETEITEAILHGLVSELDSSSKEYRKQFEYCTKLRRIGQRLDLLTDNFGLGVLGLIPFENFLGCGISAET